MNAHAQTSIAAHYQDEPTARAEFEAAFYSGASSDTILAAGRRYGEAKQASETLDERAFRLGLAAADADRRAEDALAEAAQDDLVVRVRRARFGAGDDTACNIARRAGASRIQAADAMAEAERLRSQAASIRKSQRYAADYLACLEAAQ